MNPFCLNKIEKRDILQKKWFFKNIFEISMPLKFLKFIIFSETLMDKFRSCYVTNLYMFFKLLNFLNVLVQLFLLNKFLGPQYTFWGLGIAMDLMAGRDW